MSDAASPSAKFQIFRGVDAKKLMELGLMSLESMDDTQKTGLKALVQAGYLEGDDVQVLINLPGFSLVRAWLKKDYPLLMHSHDSDCLYYVIAGTVKMGTEDLVAGDGFFVPAGVRYQYRPGAEGVEVLEFRHATHFNFQNYTKGEAFYQKALQTVKDNVEVWRTAKRPSQISS
jgi:mannose-6-phosphate isomerase-like protein (cupin superfamily)